VSKTSPVFTRNRTSFGLSATSEMGHNRTSLRNGDVEYCECRWENFSSLDFMKTALGAWPLQDHCGWC
jgi:hypothetical protein